MMQTAPTPDRRTRKRLATRQSISDAATRLFMERGFDGVTIDEIARAADVGRMTVFNHFPRKEDMFFDREDEAKEMAFGAIRSRPADISPIEALRLLAHYMVAQKHLLLPLFAKTQAFVETALASDALKARARQMRDDFVHALAAVLAGDVRQPLSEADAYLGAMLITSAWSIAFSRAHALLKETGDAAAARGLFLALVDRGALGTKAALSESPYN